MKMFEAIQPNPSYNAQGFSFVDCWLHRWMLKRPPGLHPWLWDPWRCFPLTPWCTLACKATMAPNACGFLIATTAIISCFSLYPFAQPNTCTKNAVLYRAAISSSTGVAT
ncbi:hypothetical protein JG688_00006784 [Phytophthora aleatoria]|uniref:Uncharacterized protein n=1 Tax=Phytophthora aleatoria TaxID=2496075 RepID=A0A8J5MGL9_9STRA|nr:hypothetical protein JG688_00006784 [Phytophthora aleatoria]